MRFLKENKWSRTALGLSCVAIATLLLTIAPRDEVFADDNELAAVYRNGSLEVIVPNSEGIVSNHAFHLEIIDEHEKLIEKAVRYA